MHRFFTENIAGDTAVITGDDVAHIARVLRLSPGDALTLCDGRGTDYDAVIGQIGKTSVVCRVSGGRPSGTEPACRVTLFQGLPKAGKLETIIQKCVELGVYAVAPFESVRCAGGGAQDFEKKRERCQRVALEAAKQSRRGIVPAVLPAKKLRALELSGFTAALLAYEDERGTTLKQALRARAPGGNIALIVGPEGGFAPEEAAYLTACGATPVSLGARILRTETAGMAALAQILYEVEA